MKSLLVPVVFAGLLLAARAVAQQPPESALTNRTNALALPETRERQRELLERIVRDFRNGLIRLDNGHMWLDGHVYPHAFLDPTEVRFIEALGQLRHRVVHEVQTVRYHPQWREGMQEVDFDDSDWQDVPVGLGTGRQFSEEAYRFALPPLSPPAPGRELFFALRPLHPSKEAWPETTIYINGKADAALVRWHDYWELSSMMDRTRENQITLKAFGIYDEPPRGFRQIAVVERDPVADRLYWNLRVLAEAASIIPESEPLHAEIKRLIRGVFTTVDLVHAATPHGRAKLEAADRAFEEGRLALKEKFAALRSPAGNFVVSLIYHAHHDTAWQWTVAHSRGKTERAVLNNLYLMDRYPEYRYFYTAPYHYQTLKEDRPDLYARVKEKVASGQWDANGAMWIEPDVRMPSGESLIRQMLYGMDFFEREFGVKDHVLFLPDTFGHAPVMPQLMRGFGIEALYGMRVRDANNPHDVFRWQGIDGSQVLVNAITTPAWEYPYLPELHGGRGLGGEGSDRVSYSAPDPGPRRTFGLWETFRQKNATDTQIMTIGWGDGGGGGTEDHVEVARRVADLPWLPRLETTDIVSLTKRQLKNWDRYPVYADDLYVGFQRTFTRANRIKQENQTAERRLHDTEFLGAWASLLGQPYDAIAVRKAWETMLVNHMHDIITGQSVPEVNDEAIALYDTFRAQVNPVYERSLEAVVSKIATEGPARVLVNTVSHARSRVQTVALPSGSGLRHSSGEDLVVQRLDDAHALVALRTPLPSFGYETLHVKPTDSAATSETGLSVTDRVLENRYLRIALDEHGQIASLFDKEARRELVPPGKVHNQLLAVRGAAGFGPSASASPSGGQPIIDLQSIRIVERGPLRAGWEIRRKHGSSTLVQQLLLRYDSRRIDVVNDIDWKEAAELHADFPLNLRTTTALQGVQFGYQRQTTTRNNPADAARSLLAVHQWVDIAEQNYGFALLNDGRIGHDVKSGGVRITLFTNQQVANANGDRGANRFTYALMPHPGDINSAGVQAEAADLNHPVIVVTRERQSGPLPARQSFASLDSSHVVLAGVKPAEDGQGWILRLHENGGAFGPARVHLTSALASATRVDLRERALDEVPLNDGTIELTFTPFQIQSLRVLPKTMP